jgi:hypothetical protein
MTEFNQGWGAPSSTKPKRSKLPGIVGIVALIAGITIGASGGESEAATPTAKVETKTVTETVEKTPQACLDALDVADEGFEVSSELVGTAGKAFAAISELDVAELHKLNADMDPLTGKLNKLAPRYVAAKEACRNASG